MNQNPPKRGEIVQKKRNKNQQFTSLPLISAVYQVV